MLPVTTPQAPKNVTFAIFSTLLADFDLITGLRTDSALKRRAIRRTIKGERSRRAAGCAAQPTIIHPAAAGACSLSGGGREHKKERNMSKNADVKPLEQAKEKVSEIGDKAKKGIDTTREKLHHAGEELGKRYEKVSGDVRRGAERASEVARERYKEASETVRTGYTRVRKDMDELVEDVHEYVRDNPGKAVLIAAGIGFALGLILRPRGHEDE
jgi:ElaB/YqjD/DUF883 family membrane-anchored ribosome-binding protein